MAKNVRIKYIKNSSTISKNRLIGGGVFYIYTLTWNTSYVIFQLTENSSKSI